MLNLKSKNNLHQWTCLHSFDTFSLNVAYRYYYCSCHSLVPHAFMIAQSHTPSRACSLSFRWPIDCHSNYSGRVEGGHDLYLRYAIGWYIEACRSSVMHCLLWLVFFIWNLMNNALMQLPIAVYGKKQTTTRTRTRKAMIQRLTECTLTLYNQQAMLSFFFILRRLCDRGSCIYRLY